MATNSEDSTKLGKASLISQISKLFNTETFSDITVRCRNREWKGHKSILCTQSDFFAHACEDACKEGGSGYIELQDDDPDVANAMLECFYSFGYSEQPKGPALISPALFHVRVFALAEKYVLQHLKTAAARKFQEAVERDWNTYGFAEAIVEAYKNTTDTQRQLRDPIIDVVQKQDTLFASGKLDDHFKTMTARTPAFAADVLTRMADTKLYHCPEGDCHGVFRAKMVAGRDYSWLCYIYEHENMQDYEQWQKIVAEPPLTACVAKDESATNDPQKPVTRLAY